MGYTDVVLADGPVAFWPMQETSGTLVDVAGTFDAVPAGSGGAYAQSGPCTSVKSVEFAGANYFEVADDAALSPTSMTVEAWFKVSGSTVEFALSKRPDDTTGNFEYHLLWVYGDLSFQMGDGSGNFLSLIAPAPDLDVWYHVVGTYDDGTGDGNLYIDGALVDTATSVGTPVGNTAGDLLIGDSLGYDPAEGFLTMTAIYDYALTAGQVLTHYQSICPRRNLRALGLRR
jgi:hypothetical protein